MSDRLVGNSFTSLPFKGCRVSSVLFLIRGHHSPEYLLDEKVQKETWAAPRESQYDFIWVHSIKTQEIDIHSSSRIFVDCADNFEDILEKTILGLRVLLKTKTFEYCVLTNTSSYFNLPLLAKELNKMKKYYEDVGGFHQINRWVELDGLVKGDTFVSGAGIFLSRSASLTLARLNPSEYVNIPDDIAVTHYLRKNGFKTFPKKRNTLYAHHVFIPRAHIRAKGNGNHELTRQRMKLIHKYFFSVTFGGKIIAYLKIMRNELAVVPKVFPGDVLRFLRREISRVRENRVKERSR